MHRLGTTWQCNGLTFTIWQRVSWQIQQDSWLIGSTRFTSLLAFTREQPSGKFESTSEVASGSFANTARLLIDRFHTLHVTPSFHKRATKRKIRINFRAGVGIIRIQIRVRASLVISKVSVTSSVGAARRHSSSVTSSVERQGIIHLDCHLDHSSPLHRCVGVDDHSQRREHWRRRDTGKVDPAW